MSVAIDHKQRRAGEPAGSFASGGGGAILVDMTATLTSPTFVGRTEELARLAAAADRAAAGTPTSVLIGGEAGVGKTRLVGELVAGARAAGATVLAGGCVELGGEGVPFAPLIEALRAFVRDLDEPALARLLPGQARAELARLLPELGPPAAAAGRAGGVRGRPRPLVGAGAAVRAAAGAAGAPGRRPPGRAGGRGPALGRPLDPRPARLPGPQPAPRPPAAGPHLPLRRAAPPPPAAAVPGRAGPRPPGRAPGAGPLRPGRGGGPAGRHPGGAGPGRAGRADPRPLRRQRLLRRGAGRHRRRCRAASCRRACATPCWPGSSCWPSRPSRCWRSWPWPEPPWPTRLLAEVAGLPEAELLAGLREAVSAHVLLADAGDGTYGFRHALVKEAVYAELLPGERTRLHARFAAALAARDDGDDPGLAAELAWHWYAAHDLERALPAAVAGRAGRRARLRLRRGPAPVRAGPRAVGALRRARRRGRDGQGGAAGPGGRGGRQRRRRRPGRRPGPGRPGRGRPGRRPAAGRPAHRAPGLPPADRRPAGGVRGLPGGGPAGPAGADGGPGPGPGRPGPGADAAGPLRRGHRHLRGGDRGGQGGRRPGGRGPRPQQPRHRPGPPGRPRGRPGPAGGGPAPGGRARRGQGRGPGLRQPVRPARGPGPAGGGGGRGHRGDRGGDGGRPGPDLRGLPGRQRRLDPLPPGPLGGVGPARAGPAWSWGTRRT